MLESVIPAKRVRYLSEIVENNKAYDKWAEEQSEIAQEIYALEVSSKILKDSNQVSDLEEIKKEKLELLSKENKALILNWEHKKNKYSEAIYSFKVRDKEIKIQTHTESLSHSQIPKVCLPNYQAWGDILRWNLQENVPGEFPFASGLYPFKREGEDPTRMFAGEGGPERTNRRF